MRRNDGALGTAAALQTISGALDYPMSIVTINDDDGPTGCLVGFATQSSIDPWLYTVYISELNHTAGPARTCLAAAVHFLSTRDAELSRLFGEQTGDQVDKFARCSWRQGPLGTVILEEPTRWLAGPVVHRSAPGGDHVALTISPVAAAAEGPWPGELSFQQVRDMVAGHPCPVTQASIRHR